MASSLTLQYKRTGEEKEGIMLERELSHPYAHGTLNATVRVSGDDGPELERLLETVVAGVDHYLSCNSCGIPGELDAFIETFGVEGTTTFNTGISALELLGQRVELTLGGELDVSLDESVTKFFVAGSVVPSLFGRLADMVISDETEAALGKCGYGARLDEMMAADVAQVRRLLEAVFSGRAEVVGVGLGVGVRDGNGRSASAPILH